MTKLQEFLIVNDLTQKDLCNYLGIKPPFASKIVNGRQNFPKEQREKLLALAEEKGWDASMLKGRIVQTIGDNSSNNTQTVEECSQMAERVRSLETEVELLRELVAEKDAIIELLKALNQK